MPFVRGRLFWRFDSSFPGPGFSSTSPHVSSVPLPVEVLSACVPRVSVVLSCEGGRVVSVFMLPSGGVCSGAGGGDMSSR